MFGTLPVSCILVDHPNHFRVFFHDLDEHPDISFDQLRTYADVYHRQQCACGGVLGEARIIGPGISQDMEDSPEEYWSHFSVPNSSGLVANSGVSADSRRIPVWFQVSSYNLPGSCMLSLYTRQGTQGWRPKSLCHFSQPGQLFKDFRNFSGLIFIDKSEYISHFNCWVPILVRPAGFGRTTLISMLCAFHDIHATDDFNGHFAGTTITRPNYYMTGYRPTPNQFLVLSYDLKNVEVTPDIDFADIIDGDEYHPVERYFIQVLREFLEKYASELNVSAKEREDICSTENRAHDVLFRVISIVEFTNYRIFVAVDNYNAPFFWNIPGAAFFIDYVLFQGIYTSLGVIARGIMAGTCPDGDTIVDPFFIRYTPVLSSLAQDYTEKDEIQPAFGIDLSEAADIVMTLGASCHQKENILNQIEMECPSCVFYDGDGAVIARTFKPQDVFDVIRAAFPEMIVQVTVPTAIQGLLEPVEEPTSSLASIMEVRESSEFPVGAETDDVCIDSEQHYGLDKHIEDLEEELLSLDESKPLWAEDAMHPPPSPSNSSSSMSSGSRKSSHFAKSTQ